MKKLLLVFVVFFITSCSVGSYIPHVINNFGTQTTVVLDKANFRFVRNVEVIIDVHNTDLSLADVEKSAYGALLKEANLSGSQVLINVVIEEIRRESMGFWRAVFGFPNCYQYVAARATIIEFINETQGNQLQVQEPEVKINTTVADTDSIENIEYTWIDLGLSVKWATCNIGASTPEEYGDYFAWGEIENDEQYNKNSYTCKTNRSQLDSTQDAATAQWKHPWRMPTNAEMQELKDKCKWLWLKVNGVYGYKVVGDNGNSIFLPANGYYMNKNNIYQGTDGFYWSSNISKISSDEAYSFEFDSSNFSSFSRSRYHGMGIRAVHP